MSYSFIVFVDASAHWILALELHRFQLLLGKSVDIAKFHFVISLAFLWAMLVLGGPWLKAFGAE